MMLKDLTDIKILKGLLQKEGLGPKHSMGQNFLICSEVLEATIMALEDSSRNLTELGAGVGTLTQALLASKFNVRAIERDEQLARLLKTATSKQLAAQLTVVSGDLRDEEWAWKEPFSVVGNIPYNLSGLIIKKVTQLEPQPQLVILLVQKEVGQRLVAQAPNLHLISVAVQLWGTAEMILNVPADCFYPKPKVDSQLILLRPKTHDYLPLQAREKVMALAKKFFQVKRKQMGGVVRQLFNLDVAKAKKLLMRADIRKEQRPQEITPKQWIILLDIFEEMGIDTQ
jgi:16S rRNA (adenine1518-N6/adenine1519-N6)-dimethyltransferase